MKLFPLLFLSWMGSVILVAQTPRYTLHEWGTWTTVSGADGGLLPGLQREEEGLPWFVESHEGMQNRANSPSNSDGSVNVGKGWARPLKNVTVKMETPVIYFYTPTPFDAHVAVDFRGGSISQWYPPRSGGEIPPGTDPLPPETAGEIPGFRVAGAGSALMNAQIDFAKRYEGSIQWDVKVTPPAESDSASIFRGGETPNWLFPRQTDSALVRTKDGTAEKFLFYRGVGNLPMPVTFQMSDDRTLNIVNCGDAPVSKLFIYQMGEDRSVRYIMLNGLAVGKTSSIDLEKLTWSSSWQRPVYDAMAKALVDTGLYRKEADAMLQTWWQSYFEKSGLRVLWISPSGFTEKILPLSVEPAPEKTIRVLVGRSEILTPSFEQNLVKQQKNPNFYFQKNDRFTEAYQTRLEQLTGTRTAAIAH